MIFYFSGTGNTKWAAFTLKEKTGEQAINMAVEGNRNKTYTLKKGERLGFCFPVHGWRPPLLVRSFIKSIDIKVEKDTYCYAVCTAGDNIGETIDIFRSDLSAKGIILHSSLSLIMPESYVGLPFMDVDTPENERRKKDNAEKELNDFVPYIIEKEKGINRLVIGSFPKLNTRVFGGFFTKFLITDKPFKVTEDKCLKCGKCAEACPVGNVLFSKDNVPAWKHDGSCLACFACYHHCPVHAIEYGRRTRHKGQYFFKWAL
ncbi:MAG: EFR1 family ferrodoxin [Prevotellaceae bacterium]|nr:EFR1 family ferrodoxin [Prevotellaceae bacterium]